MSALAYADTVIPGEAGYAPGLALAAAIESGQVSRSWRLGNRIVSVQLSKPFGKGIWKNSDRFQLEKPTETLAHLESAGIEHPSSWADCYHQLAPNTRILPWTFNGMFAWWSGGPWSEARKTGTFNGHWRRYDLQGAYRWAATWGLPDPYSYHVRKRRIGDAPGVWIVELQEHRPDLPSVFAGPTGLVVATTEEIEAYNLKHRVLRGVTWTKELPRDYVESTLLKLPYPKEAGRAYWGRWIARDPLVCWTPAREWPLRNIRANFVWGWLIVSRVRLRVWEVAKEAAHVYVDEVLVPHELPTGGEGEWKLKQEYLHGVYVNRTGWYGDLRAKSPTMQTGVPNARRREGN